jgi:hypothetical protein
MTTAAAQIAESVCHGALVLGSTFMNTPAWASTNNYVLWNGAPRRGENQMVPGHNGTYALRRRKHEAIRTLECLVIGDCEYDGTPYPDREDGLVTNWFILREGLLSYGTVTIDALLLLHDGTTLTGPVQIVDHQLGATGISGALAFTLDLVLPAGELVATPPGSGS